MFRSLKFTYSTRREENSQVFFLYLVSLFLHIYKSNRNSALVHMSFEESEAEFMEDYGLVQEVTSASRDNLIDTRSNTCKHMILADDQKVINGYQPMM